MQIIINKNDVSVFRDRNDGYPKDDTSLVTQVFNKLRILGHVVEIEDTGGATLGKVDGRVLLDPRHPNSLRDRWHNSGCLILNITR